MAETKCLICACCFITFGRDHIKLIKVTTAQFFWGEYDVDKECCPKKLYFLQNKFICIEQGVKHQN